jgi:hypothetical protein
LASSGKTSKKLVSAIALPYLLSYTACPKPEPLGKLAGKALLELLRPRLFDSAPLPDDSLMAADMAASRLTAVDDMDFRRLTRWAALIDGTDREWE